MYTIIMKTSSLKIVTQLPTALSGVSIKWVVISCSYVTPFHYYFNYGLLVFNSYHNNYIIITGQSPD